LTVMKGCSHKCTYCIVPSVRGPERCREPDDIVQEAEMLVENGAKELVLLGQKVNGYDKNGCTFPLLLKRLDRIDGLERIRFTSPHPKHMTDELIELFGALPTLCESLHLPVQSGSDRVLKAMKRRYPSDFIKNIARKLRKMTPDFLISTDLIVGFPGETEADFGKTLRLYEDVRFSGAFSFKYSPRPGTFAATHMEDDVPEETKSDRLDRLHEVIDRIELETRETLVGRTLEVLVEGPARKEGQITGRARNNQIVNFSLPKDVILKECLGEMMFVKIIRALPHCLEGRAGRKDSL
jgi:tRNA-2-methylthio-N6-dimethylallyladenosine synthase